MKSCDICHTLKLLCNLKNYEEYNLHIILSVLLNALGYIMDLAKCCSNKTTDKIH